ncbi:MAG TPA: dipeptide epimerase [Nocardioidaceae bacterium]|nr:dipeptide epimerase [Nocardioidaceae bacterium]
MSRIDALRCHPVRVPLHTPFVTALRRATAIESLIVEVVDSDGIRGFGEAPQVWAVTGDSLAGSAACVEGPLGAATVGSDADDLHDTCRRVRRAVAGNLAAKAAIDVALHDLAARRRGVPLPVLLGGAGRTVATDVTVSAGSADEVAKAAQERVADGFGALKLKVGTDAASDAAQVLAVREAVGPDVALRLDANQGWTPREAVRVIGQMEDGGADVELVEQPVPAADIDGLGWVTDRVQTPIMADESVFGVRDLVRVIERRASDLVNVKLAKSGGFIPARTLLDLAEAHNMGTMIGSMMETHVGVGAAASLAAAVGTTVVSDLDAAWWAAEPSDSGLHYADATVVLPDAPGLGVEAPT